MQLAAGGMARAGEDAACVAARSADQDGRRVVEVAAVARGPWIVVATDGDPRRRVGIAEDLGCVAVEATEGGRGLVAMDVSANAEGSAGGRLLAGVACGLPGRGRGHIDSGGAGRHRHGLAAALCAGVAE